MYSCYIIQIFSKMTTEFASRLSFPPCRRHGDSIGRAALFARRPRLLAKFDFIGKPPRRGGAASPAVAPPFPLHPPRPRLRRYRLIKRSMLLEHVKFALAGEREARLIRRTGETRGRGVGDVGSRGLPQWQGRGTYIFQTFSLYSFETRE